MQYYFRKFKIIDGIDGVLLLAQNCSVRVTDDAMIVFLHGAQNRNSSVCVREHIEAALDQAGVRRQQGVNFLEKTGILQKLMASPHSPFEQAILVSDIPQKMEPLIGAMEEDGVDRVK